MTEAGARVWVVQRSTADAVYAYGFGTYLGDQLMPGWDFPSILALCEQSIHKYDAAPPLIDPERYYAPKLAAGEITREEVDQRIADIAAKDAAERARPIGDRARDAARRLGMNPRIELERGGRVWGAECWWGEADDDTPAKHAKGRPIWIGPCPERHARRVHVTGSYFQGQLPEGAVYVGRGAPGLPCSPWANPFRAGRTIPVTIRLGGHALTVSPDQAGALVRDVEHAAELYREAIRVAELEQQVRDELAGRDLACWCKEGQTCHVDSLVAITNAWVPA